MIKEINMKPDKEHPTAAPVYRYWAYRTEEDRIEIVRRTKGACPTEERVIFMIRPSRFLYINQDGNEAPLTEDALIRFFDRYREPFIETGTPWFPRVYTSETKLRALMNVLSSRAYMYLVEHGYAIIDRRRHHCLEEFDCWPVICEEIEAI